MRFNFFYNLWLICFLSYNRSHCRILKPVYVILWRFTKKSLNQALKQSYAIFCSSCSSFVEPLNWHMCSPGWFGLGCQLHRASQHTCLLGNSAWVGQTWCLCTLSLSSCCGAKGTSCRTFASEVIWLITGGSSAFGLWLFLCKFLSQVIKSKWLRKTSSFLTWKDCM